MSRIILTHSISISTLSSSSLLIFSALICLLSCTLAPMRAADNKIARDLTPKMAFVKGSCWGCHARGENAINGDKPLKGSLFLRKYPDDIGLAATIRKGFPKKGMPSFAKERLSDADLALIIKYIRSLTPPVASK